MEAHPRGRPRPDVLPRERLADELCLELDLDLGRSCGLELLSGLSLKSGLRLLLRERLRVEAP